MKEDWRAHSTSCFMGTIFSLSSRCFYGMHHPPNHHRRQSALPHDNTPLPTAGHSQARLCGTELPRCHSESAFMGCDRIADRAIRLPHKTQRDPLQMFCCLVPNPPSPCPDRSEVLWWHEMDQYVWFYCFGWQLIQLLLPASLFISLHFSPTISDLYKWLHLSFPFVFLVFHSSSENLEPHSAPLEIGHPEVGRYFSEFAQSHYTANEELQMRYPEDTDKTLGVVRELYHTQTPGSGVQGHQHNHQPM